MAFVVTAIVLRSKAGKPLHGAAEQAKAEALKRHIDAIQSQREAEAKAAASTFAESRQARKDREAREEAELRARRAEVSRREREEREAAHRRPRGPRVIFSRPAPQFAQETSRRPVGRTGTHRADDQKNLANREKRRAENRRMNEILKSGNRPMKSA